jgi:Heterokaryon incompatibility protein (HET)
MGRTPESYYKYSPLPQGSIFLVKIHSTKLVKESKKVFPLKTYPLDEQLEISLETFKLSNCPRYAALSYTWGLPGSFADPKPSVFTQIERVYPIICDSAILLGTWNLRSALRQIRFGIDVCMSLSGTEHQLAKDTQRLYGDISYIWIDAVCIDQGNIPERTHQVQAMNKIYTKAHRTLVWLGEEDRYSEDAFAALGKVRNQLTKAYTQQVGLGLPIKQKYGFPRSILTLQKEKHALHCFHVNGSLVLG